MNNYFEGPKNQISTFCISADGHLNFFCILPDEKRFCKFILASMKTHTNYGDFTGKPHQNFPTPQQDWRQFKENYEAQFSF
jgi:hypothetical protein